MLDVAVAKGMSRLTVATFVGKYKAGRHEELSRLLRTGRARRVRITSPKPFAMCADGETTTGIPALSRCFPPRCASFCPPRKHLPRRDSRSRRRPCSPEN